MKVRLRELARNPLVIAVGACFLVALVLTLLWSATPLRQSLTPENATAWVTSIAGHWWTPWLLLALLVLGNIIVFPRPLVTIAAVVAYGVWQGFALSMAAAEIGTFIGYFVGRRCPPDTLERWAGPMLARMAPLLNHNGLVTASLLRLLPLGPHVLGSLALGALRIRPWQVLAGTFIGMAPGTLASALVGGQVAAGMAAGGHVNRWILWGSVLAVVVLLALTKAWYQRLSARAASPS